MASIVIDLGFLLLGFVVCWFICGWWFRKQQEELIEMVSHANAQAAAYRSLYYAVRQGNGDPS